MITASALDGGGVRHGFFDRTGGVSSGIYATRNCGFGSDDDRDAVAENRRRVTDALGVSTDQMCTLYQIHSDQVVTVRDPDDVADQKADAMVTAEPGIALGVLTADCAPILFADRQAMVVGAAHAGWKGALTGVAEATVETMVSAGAKRGDITAVIGPCIAPESYEVGPEFRERFVEAGPANARFFTDSKRAGHAMFDLPGYLLARLSLLGLRSASWTGHDTCADSDHFFSYRRSVHQSEPDYGRQVAAIALAPSDTVAP